jgi:hypothetical protein
MKKYIFAFLFLFATGSTFAQTQNISAEVKKEIEILKSANLNLSSVQLSRITLVLQGEEEIINRVKKTLDGNKSLLASSLATCKKNKISNIKGGMTDQQAEKFTALKLEEKF